MASRILSEETKKKISLANKGKVRSPEVVEMLRRQQLGKKLSELTKRKIGDSIRGEKNGNFGRNFSIETRKKMSESRKGIYIAEKHPRWKGGISRAYKTGYYSVEYKLWRKAVFERDGYTCQDCGFYGGHGYITAHHIKSFAKYPKLRFELSNGKTLCEDCHKLTDNYKGRNKEKIYV